MANEILAEIREKSIAPYCQLSDRGLEAVFTGFIDVIRLAAGEVITLSPTEHSYTSVIRGAVAVEGGPARLAKKRLDAAASADAPLVLDEQDRAITLRALENTLLLHGSGDVIDDIVAVDTLVSDQGLDADIVQLTLMRYAKGFATLPTEALLDIYQRMVPIHVEPGENVVIQDMKGDKFYFIRDGAAEVWREELEDDEPRHVATLGTGDSFGEEALILGGARNATVKMITAGKLLALDDESYNELVAKPSVLRISIDEAKSHLEDGAQLVDVRYQDEWDEAFIPGASHVPLSDIRDRMDELDRTRDIVVYCRSGRRSQVGAFLLSQNGFRAYSMDGGILGWPDETMQPARS